MVDGFATVGAALIGAGIAVVGLILGKENKVSEFRQQWIDGLRDDVSTFIGVSVAMRIQPIEPATLSNLSLQLFALEQRIALRFKKDADECARLTSAVRMLSLAVVQHTDTRQFNQRLHEVRDAAHTILEAEWVRVKRGEPGYVKTLAVAQRVLWAMVGAVFIWVCVKVLTELFVVLPAFFKA